MKNIKQMLKQGEFVYGMVVNLNDPAVIEIAGLTGYDFVRLDCEHTPFSLKEIRECIRAADCVGIPLIVRLTELDTVTGLLDFGVGGFMIPHVRSSKEAFDAVQSIKYHPVGLRGYSDGARSQRYGYADMQEYIQNANDNIVLMCQIEDKYGIEHMEEIIATPGIDGICTGPNDISQSLGIPGKVNDYRVKDVEERIINLAHRYGKYMFMSAKNEKRAKELARKGVRALSICYDYNTLREAAEKQLKKYTSFLGKE